MDLYGQSLGILIAVILVAVAGYYTWQQRRTLQTVRGDAVPRDQRRFLLKQVGRRLFNSLLMTVLAAMLIGAMFLDYDPARLAEEGKPITENEAVKDSVRFLGGYWTLMLIMLLVILSLAVFDLWATARFGVEQQKKLVQEHQNALEAELARLRHRRAELN